MPRFITLTTDFGLNGSYVGQMHGVLSSLAPDALVIDIAHQIAAHDIRSAALVLRDTISTFPPETIHLAVVDPGVGSKRRRLVIRARIGDFFSSSNKDTYLIGPDNGVLTLAAPPGSRVSVVEIVNIDRLKTTKRSSTFEGRDVFAPAAAWPANGGELTELGSEVERIVELPLPVSKFLPDGSVEGELISFDTFGNCQSNIECNNRQVKHVSLLGRPEKIALVSCFSELTEGALGALINSQGYLELVCKERNARKQFALNLGQCLSVIFESELSVQGTNS